MEEIVEIREFIEPDVYIYKNKKILCKINNGTTLLDVLLQIKKGGLSGYSISIPEYGIKHREIDVFGKVDLGNYKTTYEILLQELSDN